MGKNPATSPNEHRRKASATPTIGVIHSTSFTSVMKGSFVAGLQDGNWDTKPKPVNFSYPGSPPGGYGPTVPGLENQVKAMINNVDLILAAGGLAAGVAAVAAFAAYAAGHSTPSNTPFIFIAGEAPTGLTGSPNCVGGANLNAIAQDANMITQLGTQNVALIVNENASMAADEVAAWTGSTVVMINENNLANSWSGFLTQLTHKLTGVEGVAVSSDPYFYQYRSQLEQAIRDTSGGNFPGTICWPFALPNVITNSILCQSEAVLATTAANSNEAYYQAGLLAASVLDNVVGGTPLEDVGVVEWTWNSDNNTGTWT
jgi:hypothetical protein